MAFRQRAPRRHIKGHQGCILKFIETVIRVDMAGNWDSADI
jgi:hypothetical protein